MRGGAHPRETVDETVYLQMVKQQVHALAYTSRKHEMFLDNSRSFLVNLGGKLLNEIIFQGIEHVSSKE